MTLPQIVLTAGEPAGVGPDLIVQIAQQSWPADLVVIADPDLLLERAKLLDLPLSLIPYKENTSFSTSKKSQLRIIPIALATPVTIGQLNVVNAAYVLETLRVATQLCLSKKAAAVVTAPVHKAIMQAAKLNFLGHTEFFADLAGVKRTVMLFVIDQLKVAIATTHVPLNKVSENISQQSLQEIITILQQALQDTFKLPEPQITVTGLNPHAGESGHLGHEEIDVIAPTILALQKNGMRISGPLPADTVFTPKHLAHSDAVLAMYHDQALPLVKYIGFGKAVNVTLGLPFIRTSVDHGTALDIAGTNQVDAGSMVAALNLAIELTR